MHLPANVLFLEKVHLRGLFCQPKHSRVKVRSILWRNSMARLLAPALPRTGGRKEGWMMREKERELERVGRRKNPAASAPEPRAAFKRVGGRVGRGGEERRGRGRETAGTICTCLLYSSPRLYTERGCCAQCSNERRGGAFWCGMLWEEKVCVCEAMLKFVFVLRSLARSKDISCPVYFTCVT